MSELQDRVVKALRSVFDPEVPVNIYDLGLIYKLDIDDNNVVSIKMTLTTPACPVAGSLPGQVEAKVKEVEGVSNAEVELVWDPPWDRNMMSTAAKLQLNMDLDSGPSITPDGERLYDIHRAPDR